MLNEYYYKRTIKRVLTNIEVVAYFQKLLLKWWTIRCIPGTYRYIKIKEEKLHYVYYLTTVNESNLAKAMLFDLFGVTNCDTTRHHLNKRKSNTVNHSKHINILQTISERDTYVRKTLFTTLAQRFFVVSAVRYENDLRQRLHLTLPQLSCNFDKGENNLLLINIIVME